MFSKHVVFLQKTVKLVEAPFCFCKKRPINFWCLRLGRVGFEILVYLGRLITKASRGLSQKIAGCSPENKFSIPKTCLGERKDTFYISKKNVMFREKKVKNPSRVGRGSEPRQRLRFRHFPPQFVLLLAKKNLWRL